MSTTYAETPVFWDLLKEKGYPITLAPVMESHVGAVTLPLWYAGPDRGLVVQPTPEPVHQFACPDPYGPAAWCDCNNLTLRDACDCDTDEWCRYCTF